MKTCTQKNTLCSACILHAVVVVVVIFVVVVTFSTKHRFYHEMFKTNMHSHDKEAMNWRK